MDKFEQLRDAWDNEGVNPVYHHTMKTQLAKDWPVLYKAIVTLLKK